MLNLMKRLILLIQATKEGTVMLNLVKRLILQFKQPNVALRV